MKRLLPDGQLDVLEPGLGDNGGLYEYLDSKINRGTALAIQADGKYIVCLVRYQPWWSFPSR